MSDPHNVTVTAIIIKNGKYLITKRPSTKRLFPDKWTVPGGNLESNDYINLPKDTAYHWYNILEKVVRREVKEETGLDIKNIEYLTSMTLLTPSNPMLIISLFAEHDNGEVILNEESVAHEWVSLEEAKNYDLIEGIYEELEMLDNLLKGNKPKEWRKV
ncbi:MAG: NUDIX domain-containing protein [Candidatus Nanoarchaeia archaeon]|nr:NUDIX domain-containing protein [Candidatus Nanoarchaeia archaeon]